MKFHWYSNGSESVTYANGFDIYAEIKRDPITQKWCILVFNPAFKYGIDSFSIYNGIFQRLGPFNKRFQAKQKVVSFISKYIK